MHYRGNTTQRDFLKVAEQEQVAYVHPATFRAGEAICTVRPKAIGRFLFRLSSVMSFDDYDRLTRAVYVAHLRQPTAPTWPEPK
jgi:hypothetical protein